MSHALLRIRESITNARLEEARTRQLENYLALLAPRLHKAIALPEQNPTHALLQFVVNYIEQVPDFLQTLEEVLTTSGLQHGRVLIDIAQDYFLQPPQLVQQDKGLKALIDEAYLAHRLIEEVNDRLLMMCGTPLIPVDMTLANIIVHDLLGEQFANQLDLAVHYAVEALFEPARIADDTDLTKLIEHCKTARWAEALQNWPSLTDSSSIHLNLINRTKATAH